METHLTIKHLAPYFLHELKLQREYYSNFNGGGIVKDTIIMSGYFLAQFKIEMASKTKYKPILHPLSEFGDSDDIKKVHEFLGLGNWCEMYDEYFRVWFDDVANTDKLVLQAPQEIFNYFLANHYDVFSLIPNGLAIDINTLTH